MRNAPHRTGTGMDHADTQYLDESLRPLTSLAFVAPLLLTYEAGMLAWGPDAMRNGADVWLRTLLDRVGFGQYFLLPLLTCFALVAWHHVSRQPWRFSFDTLSRMGSETLFFAVALVVASQFQNWVLVSLRIPPADLAVASTGPVAARTVSFLGAGIYEELLFRLMLVPLLAAGLTWLGEGRRTSLAVAVVVSSLLFAAAHYRLFTGAGDEFLWATFLFRFSAGMLFATLFVFRGFGITVGAHAVYDVLVSALYP